MTRQAVESGLRANPPVDRSDEALHAAVLDALRSQQALADVMNAIVRYSPTVQDVSVTDAHGFTMAEHRSGCAEPAGAVSDEPDDGAGGRRAVPDEGVFGKPQVLDIAQSLERNGVPFLVVHVGVRSTFLKNSYEPWLMAALALRCWRCWRRWWRRVAG